MILIAIGLSVRSAEKWILTKAIQSRQAPVLQIQHSRSLCVLRIASRTLYSLRLERSRLALSTFRIMPDSISKSESQSLEQLLEHDTKVKVAGVDIDGILRGKLMSKKKFLSIAKSGFGFCSVIFGWDMHDQTYFKELKISNAENGYRDIIAVPDLESFRRIPWEDNVPFFLLSFMDPDTGRPVSACPRGLLKTASEKLERQGLGAMAGG